MNDHNTSNGSVQGPKSHPDFPGTIRVVLSCAKREYARVARSGRKFTTSGGQVEWNTELVSIQHTSSTVNAIIRHADQREEAIEAAWLVGADGSHSPVRHALALKFAGESYKQALFLADVDIAGDRIGNEVFGGFTRLGFFTFFPMPGGRFRALGSLPLEYSNRDTLTV